MTADERLALINIKIERAKKHIEDLDRARRAFLDANPYAVGHKRDPQTRKLIYYVTRVDPTPITLAATAGDILHNLRSALDHLAYQLVLVGTGGGGGTGKHIYFPIAKDATEYKRESPRKVKGMRQDAIDAINAIEPYGGGKGSDLLTLHALNNIDKHRLVVTVGGSFQSVDVGPIMAANMKTMAARLNEAGLAFASLFIKPAETLCPLKVGDELFIDAPDAEVNEKVQFGLDVALNEPAIVEGKPLLETVQQFADLVSNILPRLKPLLA